MKDNRGKERKVLPSFVTKIDGEQGIVEHTVAVMGNVDLGGDRIHNGAFTKTISERAGKIRVLDSHNSNSVLDVLGKPLALWEVGRDELPADVRARFPDATGALMARTQFLMDTPEGKGAFTRIRDGALGEYSIGYDSIQEDYTDELIDEKQQSIRNLKEIRLWEYSPVPFGMNSATSTLSAKETARAAFDEEDQAQMQNWFKSATQEERADMWRAYCASEGKRTLDILDDRVVPTLLEYEQDRYADGKGLLDQLIQDVVDQDASAGTGLKAGRVFSARNATRIRGHIDGIQQALSDLDDMLSAAMPSIDEPETDEPEKTAPAPDEQAATGNEPQAGPNDSSPTKEEKLAEIENALATIQRELSEDKREPHRMA